MNGNKYIQPHSPKQKRYSVVGIIYNSSRFGRSILILNVRGKTGSPRKLRHSLGTSEQISCQLKMR